MHIVSTNKDTGEVQIDGGGAGPRLATDADKVMLIAGGALDASFAPKKTPDVKPTTP
jgi:hypothetical protein